MTDFDADSFRLLYVCDHCKTVFKIQPVTGQIKAVLISGEAERAAELPRSVQQFIPLIAGRESSHDLLSFVRLSGSHKHRRRKAFGFGDKIQTVVHPINKIDIGKPRRAEHNVIPRCSAPSSMTGRVLFANVSFDLNYLRRKLPQRRVVDDVFADKLRRHLEGRSSIKRTYQLVELCYWHIIRTLFSLVGRGR